MDAARSGQTRPCRGGAVPAEIRLAHAAYYAALRDRAVSRAIAATISRREKVANAHPGADSRGAEEREVSRPVARHRVVRFRQGRQGRSEEHTSELQSHSDLVCRLLLEK